MGLGLKLGGGVMDESGEEVFAKGGDEGGTGEYCSATSVHEVD